MDCDRNLEPRPVRIGLHGVDHTVRRGELRMTQPTVVFFGPMVAGATGRKRGKAGKAGGERSPNLRHC